MVDPILSVRTLSLDFADGAPALRDVNLNVVPGRVLGITGASGSGKTLLANALLGLLPPGAHVTKGHITVRGTDLLSLAPEALQAMRRQTFGLIVQNPRAALHPMLTIGKQIARLGPNEQRSDKPSLAADMLAKMGINDASRRAQAFAHELSGGMAQRALIAAALAKDPTIVIADEPTSGLDVTVQAQILDMMWQDLQGADRALVLITQEAGILANYCDDIGEMTAGRLSPIMPASAYLKEAPSRAHHDIRGHSQAETPLLCVKGLRKTYRVRGGKSMVTAVGSLDLDISAGEVLGLVGESGSGKSTVGRCIVRLEDPDDGMIHFSGADLAALTPRSLRPLRKDLQIVLQDPFDSFNPRVPVGASLVEGVHIHSAEIAFDPAELMRMVGLDPSRANTLPAGFSAGDLQKLSIARAMSTKPKFIVLDEPTSVLAPQDRADILALIARLRDETGTAFLFISHDLTSVAQICDRVAIMYLSQLVEVGPAAQVFDAPLHPYSKALLAAHLGTDPNRRRVDNVQRYRLDGEIPSPIDLPVGCYLASRCPDAQATCSETKQDLISLNHQRQVRCWKAAEVR